MTVKLAKTGCVSSDHQDWTDTVTIYPPLGNKCNQIKLP